MRKLLICTPDPTPIPPPPTPTSAQLTPLGTFSAFHYMFYIFLIGYSENFKISSSNFQLLRFVAATKCVKFQSAWCTVLLPDKPYCDTIVASRVYFTRLCTLSVSKVGGQNLKTVIMQNAWILSKCNSFRIAIQWFLTKLYTSIPAQTKYGHLVPCL